jgi:hypothetical protein
MVELSRRAFGLGALALAAAKLPAGSASASSVPVPADGAYFGVYNYVGNDLGVSDPQDLETVIGRQVAINHSFQSDYKIVFAGSGHEWRARRDLADGRIPMISWGAGGEERIGQLANGEHTQWIDAQVAALGALGGPVFLRFTWEFDLRYVNTDNFVAAWQRVRASFAAGAPNVSFVWCPTWRAYRETDKARLFYPRDDDVDWIAADAYARPNPDKPDYDYRAFDLMLDKAHEFAVAKGKPFMVGETGVDRHDTEPRQATWLAQTHTDILDKYPNLKAFVYFHRDGTKEDQQWRVTVDADAQRAFTDLATDPYFARSIRS